MILYLSPLIARLHELTMQIYHPDQVKALVQIGRDIQSRDLAHAEVLEASWHDEINSRKERANFSHHFDRRSQNISVDSALSLSCLTVYF